jgi:hypothetical protein
VGSEGRWIQAGKETKLQRANEGGKEMERWDQDRESGRVDGATQEEQGRDAIPLK